MTAGLRSDAARNHLRIVTAATEAFEIEGAAVSLDEIANRAGVGIATLYRRFGTREDLIKAVAEHVFAEEIAGAIVTDGPDPWTDLVTSLAATVDAFAAHRVLVSLASEHAVLSMDTMAAYAVVRDRLLQRAIEAGVVRPDLTVADLKAIVVMGLAVVQKEQRAQSDEPRCAPDSNVQRHLSLLFDGMRPTGKPLPAGG